MIRHLLSFLAVLIMCTLVCNVSQAITYTVTDLGFLDGEYSYAFGINNSGQIVGNSGNGGGNAFLYHDGAMTDLGTLGGNFSGAERINASGQVVGSAALSGGGCHAFLYSSGSMINLGTLGGFSSFGYGINDKGEIVGFSETTDGYHAFHYNGETMIDLGRGLAYDINNAGQIVGAVAEHATIYKSGTKTDMGTLGGLRSEAHAINEAGQVVGWADTADGRTRAFLYDNGMMTNLGTAGEGDSAATDINSSGQIVGYLNSTLHTGFGDYVPNYAFLYSDGIMTKLNDLVDPNSGWFLSFAYGINDAGQIVGSGIHNSRYSAFLLTPVPEPSTLALFGTTLLGLWSAGIYRRFSSSKSAP